MAATEFVPAGMKNDDDGDWDVDFEYVARGFLSHKVPYVLGYMKFEDLELSAKVVRNFLNYVCCTPRDPPLCIVWELMMGEGDVPFCGTRTHRLYTRRTRHL